MIALVKTQKGEGFFSLEERPVPQIADDEVLVKVAYGGICGTDIHIYHDQFTYYPPVIVGHEFSGTLLAVSVIFVVTDISKTVWINVPSVGVLMDVSPPTLQCPKNFYIKCPKDYPLKRRLWLSPLQLLLINFSKEQG